ncbi:MAG: exonuclease SbcCD subunit D [Nitrososphaeria archaeon]
MSVQILLTADNHLDPPVTQFGPKRMQRKADYLRSFETTISYALENRPDLFLVSGDLHDVILPRNPPRALIMRRFRELSEKGIRVFLIGGHHDTPRAMEHGNSPLAVYGNAGYATFLQNTRTPEADSLDLSGLRVFITGLSYDSSLPFDADPLKDLNIQPEGDINILMIHYPVEGFPSYFGNEPRVRASSIPGGFHLIAAGHLHRHQKGIINGVPVIYPGSTERKSFLEEGEKKGFAWIELDKNGLVSDEFIETPARDMKTHDFNIPKKGSVSEVLRAEVRRFADPELIFRVRILGNIEPQRLATYRRPQLLSEFSDQFFWIQFDERKMQILTSGPIQALPRTTPREQLREFYSRMIQEAEDEDIRRDLREALAVSEQMLEEEGAW